MPKFVRIATGKVENVSEREASRYRQSPNFRPVAEKPNRSDRKARWVEYAVTQGLDRSEAEDTNKSDLVDEFG